LVNNVSYAFALFSRWTLLRGIEVWRKGERLPPMSFVSNARDAFMTKLEPRNSFETNAGGNIMNPPSDAQVYHVLQFSAYIIERILKVS